MGVRGEAVRAMGYSDGCNSEYTHTYLGDPPYEADIPSD
jgi:hypothetical protein